MSNSNNTGQIDNDFLKKERFKQKKIEELDSEISVYTKVALFLVGMGGIFFIVGFLIVIGCNDENYFNLNLFGDYVGGTVASIWSLAGLIFIYVAFLGQKQQMIYQQIEILQNQHEVRLTREQIEGQKNEMAEQNKTLQLQRFESTLFQMIENYHQIIDKLTTVESTFSGSHLIENREVLKKIASNVESRIGHEIRLKSEDDDLWEIETQTMENTLETIEAAYKFVYFDRQKQQLSHYFRNVYHIFKFIKLNKYLSNQEKLFYAAIMRAQLSTDEQYLILYNSLIEGLGYPNFMYLIRELDIMQNFDFTRVKQYKYHMEIYEHRKKLAEPLFEAPAHK